MPHPLISRLEDFMHHKRLNAYQLSIELGYKGSEKLQRLFREEDAKPSADTILDICKQFPELNPTWWLTGEGNMLRSESNSKELIKGTGTVMDEAGVRAIILSKMPEKQKVELVLRLIENYQFEVVRLKEALAFKNELLAMLDKPKKG
jgi:hypothetical protein